MRPIKWDSCAAEGGYIGENLQARLLLGHADLLGAVAAALPAVLPVAACAAPEADAPLWETVGELPPWAEWIAGFAPDTSPPAPPVGSMIYTSEIGRAHV